MKNLFSIAVPTLQKSCKDLISLYRFQPVSPEHFGNMWNHKDIDVCVETSPKPQQKTIKY